MVVKIEVPHDWNLSPAEAIALQKQLREKVISRDEFGPLHFVAGVDVGMTVSGAKASVVVVNYPQLRPEADRPLDGMVVETAIIEEPFHFPYIPGLLAFREGPAVLKALEQIKTDPDLFVFDAHGYSHPRRCGLASHLGVILDKPSIGCAKSKLCGAFSPPGPKTADSSPLIDHEEEIGRVVRTKVNSPPVFISVGHKICLPSAVRLILTLAKVGQRLPEPTRLAHLLSTGSLALNSKAESSREDIGNLRLFS